MAKVRRAAKEPTESADMEALFETYLTESIPEATLLKYERLYIKGTGEQNLSQQVIFDYAVCLIKSRYATDIKRGLVLMEDLTLANPKGNREHLYFLSHGYARLKDYSMALSILKAYLEIEPGNVQIMEWHKFLDNKMKREAAKGLAVTIGAASAIGGLVGLGFALLKLRLHSH